MSTPGFTLVGQPGFTPVEEQKAQAPAQAAPSGREMPRSWSDVSLANPLEGGVGAAAKRSIDYGKGEVEGAYEGAKGMVTGAGKVLGDIATSGIIPALLGHSFSQQATNLGEDIKGVGKGLWQTATAPFHWSTYRDPKQFGNEAFNLAAMLYSPKAAAEVPGKLETGVKVFTPKEQLHIEAAKRLYEAQAEAIDHLKKGEAAYEAITDHKAQAIAEADKQMHPIDARSVNDAMVQRRAELNPGVSQAAQAPAPRVDSAISIVQGFDLSKMSFEQLKNMRSQLGKLFDKKMSSQERGTVGAAYEQATQLLKQRADDLKMGKEFDAYNKEYKSLVQFRENTLNDLKQLRPDPIDFFKEFKANNVPLNNALEKFNDATNPYGIKGQGAGESVRKIVKDTKPFQNALSQGEGANFMGRMRAIMKHPFYGMAGATLGMMPGQLLPGGRWVGGMIGATKGSAFADRLTLAEALVHGPTYGAGAAQVAEGAGGMLPKQVKAGLPSTPKPAPSDPMTGYKPGAGTAAARGGLPRSVPEVSQPELERQMRYAVEHGTPEEAALADERLAQMEADRQLIAQKVKGARGQRASGVYGGRR